MASGCTINRTIQLMLTGFGIWPGVSCAIIHRAFWIITLAISEFFHYRYLVTHLRLDNLFDLMDCLSSFLAHVKVMVNIVIFSLKRRTFIKIIKIMSEDCSNSSNSDIALRETSSKVKLSSRISNGLIILHTIGACAYIAGINLADVDVTDRTADLPLMMKMEYPFVIDTQLEYALVLITQFMYVMVCSWGNCTVNCLLITLTLHVGGQINVLLCWFMEVEGKETETKYQSVTTIASKIIQKHQKIITLSESIENLYSYTSLLQFTSNIIIICSLGFIMITSIGNPDAIERIMRTLLFYVLTNFEAFIFCFAGEYLSNKSKAIGNAAYNSAWYDMKIKDRETIMFIIIRSQKQLSYTTGKMMILSLNSFTSIMKASGSYLSVLLAMR